MRFFIPLLFLLIGIKIFYEGTKRILKLSELTLNEGKIASYQTKEYTVHNRYTHEYLTLTLENDSTLFVLRDSDSGFTALGQVLSKNLPIKMWTHVSEKYKGGLKILQAEYNDSYLINYEEFIKRKIKNRYVLLTIGSLLIAGCMLLFKILSFAGNHPPSFDD